MMQCFRFSLLLAGLLLLSCSNATLEPVRTADLTSRPDVPTATRNSKKSDILAYVRSYHLEHHVDDEKYAGVDGHIQFTDFEVSLSTTAGQQAIVIVEVSKQKSALPKGVAWLSGKPSWKEKWRLAKSGWLLVNRLELQPFILYTD